MNLTNTPSARGTLAAALKNSALFERWVDPDSGVESFILTQRAAPIQQSFYFVNSGFTDDGRFLGIYCAFPPGGDAYYGRQLAVVDFAEHTVWHCPETQFMDASPFVDGATGEVYWTTGLGIWKRGPRPNDPVERVGQFPPEFAKRRRPLRIATHLSRSADGRAFAIDAQIGNEWFVGDIAVNGGGGFRLWQKFDLCHNHAQFSPTDPNLLLLAQDGWVDPSTGREGETKDRLWLLRHGDKAEPLLPKAPLPSSLRGHEWWSADGRDVWFIDYRAGTARVDIATGERTLVWPNGHTHSHCDRAGRLLVGDVNPQGDHWRVAFFNVNTGREIDIVSKLAPPPVARSAYHIHPHPRFCLDDRFICYTTNVLGRVDVAITPVNQLVERTSMADKSS
jgi:hypothetical protein